MNSRNQGYYVRMSKQLESKVLSVAEKMGISVPEALRHLAEKGLNGKSYEQLLHDTEVRLLRKSFEICAATVGLSPSEKDKAKKVCNDAFEQEVL